MPPWDSIARPSTTTRTAPVSITFAWDDGLDIDNHAAIAKAVVDALKGYLLPDDDHRWYRQVIHRLWDGGCIRVEVTEL